jgi:hypothetical protein
MSSSWRFVGYFDADVLVELTIDEEIVITHWIEDAALEAKMHEPLVGI